MSTDFIQFIGLLILFIIFYIIAIIYKNKPISNNITIAGIGAILAGSFFGIVKDSILNTKNNQSMTTFIILFFFIWFILTKFISSYIKGKEVDTAIPTEDASTDLVEKSKKVDKPKLDGLYKSLISFIIIFIIVILGIAFYQGGGQGDNIFMYNIIVTVVVSLAVIFSFFSGNRLDYISKIEILSYTFSFGIVFGILAPLFVFNTFSFKNSITLSLIFFVWFSITLSIGNYVQIKEEYIKRV